MEAKYLASFSKCQLVWKGFKKNKKQYITKDG